MGAKMLRLYELMLATLSFQVHPSQWHCCTPVHQCIIYWSQYERDSVYPLPICAYMWHAVTLSRPIPGLKKAAEEPFVGSWLTRTGFIFLTFDG